MTANVRDARAELLFCRSKPLTLFCRSCWRRRRLCLSSVMCVCVPLCISICPTHPRPPFFANSCWYNLLQALEVLGLEQHVSKCIIIKVLFPSANASQAAGNDSWHQNQLIIPTKTLKWFLNIRRSRLRNTGPYPFSLPKISLSARNFNIDKAKVGSQKEPTSDSFCLGPQPYNRKLKAKCVLWLEFNCH